ncbi:MAG: hypothetical protein DMD59_02815 [Gemmatimonadetes bacterium]|nr:MAG: hypothetical protein DMD59_02815 [Gemmatimonadota bacterium]
MTALPTVSARTKLGLEILAFGAAGGLIGDALLRAMPWGLNVALGTAGLVGAGAWLVRRHRITPGPDTAWLAITALLLGAAFVRRDAADLAQFDMLALVGALAFAAASLQGERIMRWSVIDYVRVGVTATIASIVGGLILIGRDIDWREMPREGRLRQLRGVLAGIVIAAPLLVVFAALFAAADQVFANVLQNLLVFDAANIVTHTFFIFFWGALTAGWLRWSLIGRPVAGPKMEYLPPTVTPFVVALGLLNALFLLFVVVQLRYFFGGAALVEQTGGLTYAEYARTGFFQLVTASGLVLPVLLGADFMARGGTTPQIRTIRQFSGLLLVLLTVVMASALERMRLYVSAFGLSTTRLYATAFMVFLIGVFAWFAWTVLRGTRHRFAFGALTQGLAVLAGLHLLNPDAFIVKTNLRRPAAERPFDAKYALTLGGDAVPPLLAALPALGAEDRCIVVHGLVARWDKEESDWRTWNWSRARARALVRHQADALKASCPTKPGEQRNDH